MNAIFQTKHHLPFEAAAYPLNLDDENDWKLFRVGTCEGLWCSTDNSYDILAITNNTPGNGHFTDVLQWFEFSCRRDGKDLRILEVWNKGLKRHLVKKQNFSVLEGDTLIKAFKV